MLSAAALQALYNECLHEADNIVVLRDVDGALSAVDNLHRKICLAFDLLRKHAGFVEDWTRRGERNPWVGSPQGLGLQREQRLPGGSGVGVDVDRSLENLRASLRHLLTGGTEWEQAVKRNYRLANDLMTFSAYESTPEYNNYMAHRFHALEQTLYMGQVLFNCETVVQSFDGEIVNEATVQLSHVEVFRGQTEGYFLHTVREAGKNHTGGGGGGGGGGGRGGGVKESEQIDKFRVRLCVSDWNLAAMWMDLYTQHLASQQSWHAYEIPRDNGSEGGTVDSTVSTLNKYLRCSLAMTILHAARALLHFLECETGRSHPFTHLHGTIQRMSDRESILCLDEHKHFRGLMDALHMDAPRLYLAGKHACLIAIETQTPWLKESDLFLPGTAGNETLRNSLFHLLYIFQSRCREFRFTNHGQTVIEGWIDPIEDFTLLMPPPLNLARHALIKEHLCKCREACLQSGVTSQTSRGWEQKKKAK